MKTLAHPHIQVDSRAAPPAAIGIDIGGTNHTAALVDHRGEVLELLRGRTDRSGGPSALLLSLRRLVPDLIADATERDLPLAGIGVGFGGPVDYESGRILLSHHVEGWEDFPLRDEIASVTGLPVRLDNDANAGGLGEWLFGAGKGHGDMVYYNIGTGIGGAIILDGRLRRGLAGIAGEIGHTTIDPHGPICTCGHYGCLEALASGSAIARMMAENPVQWQGRTAAAEDLFEMVRAGVREAISVRDQVAEAIAISISNVLHTLNPQMVVIGGGVSRGGEDILKAVRQRTKSLSFPAAFASCEIAGAALGYDAGVIGAAALAMETDC